MLKGKTALVTGATSGIGAAVSRTLAAAGAAVVVVGRDQTKAMACVEEIVGQGGKAHYVVGDVTNSAFADEAVTFAVDRFERLDTLVNAAGVIHRGSVEETSDEAWRWVMATNVDGLFYMSRAAVPVMRASGSGGSIINLASNVGLVGCPSLAAYCASKGAVVQLTRAMALDHAAENIRVNAVCPGAVDTPMLVSGRESSGLSPEEVLARNVAEVPQGRIPKPEEIADLIAFLASDASRHITGAAIPIDGGYTAA